MIALYKVRAMDINANVNRLRYFQAVCRYDSVTRAATELNITQPSVTAAIQDLEKELNIILFHRYKNKLILTKEGVLIHRMSEQLLNTIDYFFQEVKDIRKIAHSKVRLGAPPILGTRLIPEIYSSIVGKLPHVSLEIIESGSGQALKYLDENILDLAVVLTDQLSPNYYYQVFHETKLHFCININHPFAKKTHITCADLVNFPIAILSQGTFHQNFVNHMFEKSNIKPNIVLQSLELLTIRRVLENNDIGTFTYPDIFKDYPNIIAIPCENISNVGVALAWCKNKYTSHAEKDVIEFFKTHQWVL